MATGSFQIDQDQDPPHPSPVVTLSHNPFQSLVLPVHTNFVRAKSYYVGRCSSVGIATSYRLDGWVIESRSGRDFPHLSRPALWSTQLPVQWVPGLFRG